MAITKTINEFIEEANIIHNNFYDYTLVNYINIHTKVQIICPKHGIFWKSPNKHLHYGQGCPLCSLEKVPQCQPMEQSKVLDKFNLIHNNFFDYSKVIYINDQTKICIICPKHGDFWQRPYHHKQGVGCPTCKKSHGEKQIEKWLKEHNIKFEPQKKFNDCKYKHCLYFDFYLPEHNIIIEYDGHQHFKPINFFGGENTFKLQQIKDNIKNMFCQNNNINLIRIPYQRNINIIYLEKYLKVILNDQ